MNDAKLERCPFCGSHEVDPTGWSSVDTQGPSCDNCGACAGETNKSLEGNIALWNTRSDPPRERMRAALEALLDATPQEKCDADCTDDNCPWRQARAALRG